MDLRTAAVLLGMAAAAAGFGGQLGVLEELQERAEQVADALADGVRERDPSIARVLRVVDGDTIRVRLGGREETVRYIGVDTPETKKPGAPVECFGRRASAENARLVRGERLRLVPGAEPRDRYGRLLAYARRERDGAFVNERLLRGGFARTLTIPPNDRYATRFARAERRARASRRGLWGRC